MDSTRVAPETKPRREMLFRRYDLFTDLVVLLAIAGLALLWVLYGAAS